MDLEKVRERPTKNKDSGGMHSYSLLVANYGGIMAIPTDPLYCLVYPTVYNNNAEEQSHGGQSFRIAHRPLHVPCPTSACGQGPEPPENLQGQLLNYSTWHVVQDPVPRDCHTTKSPGTTH